MDEPRSSGATGGSRAASPPEPDPVQRLAGGLAHDFNNLLQAICGFADLARDQIDPSCEAAHFLGEARKAAQRAIDLNRQLLLFSRRQVPLPQVLPVDPTLERLVPRVTARTGERTLIDFAPGAPQILALIDPEFLEHLLVCLCESPLPAAGKPGRLTLATSPWPCPSPGGEKAGTFVAMSAELPGIAVPPAGAQQVFEPYALPRQAGLGSRLGLATVKAIVEAHGGEIFFSTAPAGGGTLTTLWRRR